MRFGERRDDVTYAPDIEAYRNQGKSFFYVPPCHVMNKQHWTSEEIEMFEAAVLKYGGDSYSIAKDIPSKERK